MKLEELIIQIDEYTIHVYFDANNESENISILEAKHKGQPIGGKYSAIEHSPHTPLGQKHLHFYARGNSLAAINLDGTAHDRSHGYEMPNRVIKGVEKYFPHFTIPTNGIIESTPRIPNALITFKDFIGEN
jgi:hypothetical protein